jgi:Cof subfamily protein (haloacid dehalogenase superfamily)
MIKLIALDLDGTLTDDKKNITPHTLEALMQVQRQGRENEDGNPHAPQGVRVVLASGRPPYGMRPLARQLHMEQYGGIILCYNGGHVEDCATGEVYVERQLPEGILPMLHRFQEESGMTLMTYYEDKIYTEHPADEYVGISAYNNKMQVVGVKNFITDTPRPLNKCLMVGPHDKQVVWEKKIQEATSDQLYVCHSTPYFIEILPKDIDKGPSLVSLCQRLGISSSEMMTFGDSNNDKQMIQLAGIGVAMGNADDDIKQVADFITLDNNSDGVAYALKHFGLIQD